MKKITAIISVIAMIAGSVPMYANAYSRQTTGNPVPVVDWNKWDDFIKYDLRITDFYSLDREKQNLCKFIFETEMSSPEDIVCERARRIVAGQDVGERVTVEKLKQYEAIGDCKWLYCFIDSRNYIRDDYSIIPTDFYYVLENVYTYFCVPDIKYVGEYGHNEYWLDDEGTEYIRGIGEAVISAYEYKEYIPQTFEYVNRKTNEKIYLVHEEPIEHTFINYNEFEFTVYPDNTLSLEKVDYDKNDSDVIEVPAMVDGMPVKQIASKCFEDAPYTEIVLPEGIEYIEPYTFYKCHNLETVNFPDSLKNIGVSAFSECDNLGTLEITCSDMVAMWYSIFENCSVENLVLGTEKVRTYHKSGSYGNNIGKITLLDGVKEINARYLQDDTEIPESVTIISGHTYDDITVPEQIEILGAFDDIRPYIPNVYTGGAPAYPHVPLYDEDYSISPYSYIQIFGYRNTEAERYALAHDYLFYPLDDDVTQSDNNATSGDANGDGKINIADAVLLQRYLLGNAEISGNADANNDGVVDIFDMVYMRKLLIG